MNIFLCQTHCSRQMVQTQRSSRSKHRSELSSPPFHFFFHLLQLVVHPPVTLERAKFGDELVQRDDDLGPLLLTDVVSVSDVDRQALLFLVSNDCSRSSSVSTRP